ncbi:uncharacterized protein [Dendropsophus ebraccatus]|uniref:uncharacterized protein n=1 Tax=Dendropsophus ebraccatus TaxID=150705 RepID=UPI0038318E65
MLTMRPVVGIFSRDCDSSYRFLTDFLRAQGLEVRSFTITNSAPQRFREKTPRCDFAILYHTKNRGRLNITDVTDSLYDEEIRDLSTALGKQNVLVVADDLGDSSSEMTRNLLETQPLIGEMAAQLFLFSRADKASADLLNVKLQELSSHIPRKISPGSGLNNQSIIMLVVGAFLLIYNWSIECLLIPVRVIQWGCTIIIQYVMIPVRVIQWGCTIIIQYVMIPVRFIQWGCTLIIQYVMSPRRT